MITVMLVDHSPSRLMPSIVRVYRDDDCEKIEVPAETYEELASRVAAIAHRVKPSALLVDETGPGRAVYDRLRHDGFFALPVRPNADLFRSPAFRRVEHR